MYTNTLPLTVQLTKNPTPHKPVPRSTVRVNAGKSLGAIVLNLMRSQARVVEAGQEEA